jgi:hypothetical protein
MFRFGFNLGQELCPRITSDFLRELVDHERLRLGLKDRIMQLAETSKSSCDVPALLHVAGSLLSWRDILSEVQKLFWADVLAHTVLEVLISDLPIMIVVNHVKDVLKLLFSDCETPVIEISLQFKRIDGSRFTFV